MPPFRDHTPKRRNIITTVTSYGDHKADLKIDFSSRCGYCNSPDSWKIAYYEVDHFIPYKRNKVVFLTIKSKTDYSNLVYSCRSCNNAKRNKWPTNDQNISNQNNEGFIDPCDDDYLNHFSRNANGRIDYESVLGKWMYDALKLYKPQHEVIWNIEQIEVNIKQIKNLVKSNRVPDKLKDKIIKTFDTYTDYIDQLRNL